MWRYRLCLNLRLEDQVLKEIRKKKALRVDMKTKNTVEAFPLPESSDSCYSLGHTRVGGRHETEERD